MKFFLGLIVSLMVLSACVPAKKYNDLLSKEKECSEELKKYKTSSLDNEAKLKTVEAEADLMRKSITTLKKDTSEMGQAYRSLRAQYKKAIDISTSVEKQLEEIKSEDAKQLARMRADLESKIIETQRKEDALIELEKELKTKQRLLIEREERVKELEELIARKDQAVKELKERVAQALRGFTDKGLSVEEKDGKIYVSLEAKLLFASGSTLVEPEGKKAVIQLAKAIEDEQDLEIIVEGHTDTDKLSSRSHPKDNWELSVLRATSVVDIMTSNTGINPAILSASGRSEFHPVDEFDKAKNRRIEVIISPNLDELFEMISN
ncbi:MAG: OmpA family protein [Brumimicrobium sp.]